MGEDDFRGEQREVEKVRLKMDELEERNDGEGVKRG